MSVTASATSPRAPPSVPSEALLERSRAKPAVSSPDSDRTDAVTRLLPLLPLLLACARRRMRELRTAMTRTRTCEASTPQRPAKVRA